MKEERLGTIQEVILSSDCKAHCKLISQCFDTNLASAPTKILFAHFSSGLPAARFELGRWRRDDERIYSHNLQLLKTTSRSDNAGMFRELHSLWIDRGLPKRWKQACDRFHGSRCSDLPVPARLSSTGPKWLIDIWRQCLVRVDQIPSYVALSYVWERTDSFMTLREHLCHLQRPNALSPETVPKQVAKTIRIAMHVVELLGERYLWADQLCIVQDDDAVKLAEIQNMAAIYAHASLTIVADDSAVTGGIAGIYSVTGPRKLDQKIHSFRNRDIIELIPNPWGAFDPPSSRWSTRGWTFQEGVFSRRRLVFAANTVRWECNSTIWTEDHRITSKGMTKGYINNNDLRRFSGSIPAIPTLTGLINRYSGRDFTYQEDTLLACAGFLSVLHSSYSGGFISGLPRGFFDSALLWIHYGTSTRRRADFRTARNVCLPSWSWAGWKGWFSNFNWHDATDFIRTVRTCSHAFTPRVKWYTQTSLGADRIAVDCDWMRYRHQYTDTDTLPPPPGWTRQPIEERNNDSSPPLHVIRSPRWIYKHESLPKSEFWHPLPFGDTPDDMPPNVLVPYISCRTQKAIVIGGERFESQGSAHRGPNISLLDQSGIWIGALDLHEEPPKGDEADWTKHRLIGAAFEMVDVGAGRCPAEHSCPQMNEWLLKERPRTGEYYEWIYTLWIEWEDGIAYRKGLGRIVKAAWETLNKEEIDLILG
jgi:hypothetical protein